MTFYYQPVGAMMAPQPVEQMPMPNGPVNEKPLHGMVNGNLPVSPAYANQAMSAQYYQTPAINHNTALPISPQTGQVLAQSPQPHLGIQQPQQQAAQFTIPAAASPYPVSKSAMMPQSPLIASPNVYQGAGIAAYPPPNVSPAGVATRMTVPNNTPYAVQMGPPANRPMSPYAMGVTVGQAMTTVPPGAVPNVSMPQPSSNNHANMIPGYTVTGYPPPQSQPQPATSFPAISGGAPPPQGAFTRPPQPVYTMSVVSSHMPPPHNYEPVTTPSAPPAGLIMAPAFPRSHLVRTATLPAAFPQPQVPAHAVGGLPSYPAGMIATSPPGHHIQGLSPAVGAPLVANPTYHGASPYLRSLP